MRIFGLVLAGLARDHRADGRSRQRPGVEFVGDQRGAGIKSCAGVGWRRFGSALGGDWGPPDSGPRQQWNRESGFAHWGPSRQYGGRGPYGGSPVPTYWVWVPGSAVFDYPFADWLGPTGGWGNP